MKKAISVLLALVLLCAFAPAAFAASDEQQNAADTLHALGLFRGKGDNADGTPFYDLDAEPTRNEAITMFVRLLGKDEEATNGTWSIPFTDVDDWAIPYVGYAYYNGLTKGTGDTTFEGERPVSASEYLTFVLRALGYDSSMDFEWDKAWVLSDKIGLTDGRYHENSGKFLRGDVAQISLSALSVTPRNAAETLAQILIADGVFTQEAYTRARNNAANETPITLEKRSFDTSEGSASVWVLTADTRSPRLTVRSAMVNNTLGATENFRTIVEQSGAYAACNGNFFESYQEFQTPIGHVMADGVFLHAVSGVSSLCIDKDGGLQMGRISVSAVIRTGDGKEWTAYDINNVNGQTDWNCALYTPAYGTTLTLATDAYLMTVSGGVIRDYRRAAAGEEAQIPSDGYILFLGLAEASTPWFFVPVAGTAVKAPEYRIDGVEDTGIVSIVSGAPRLIQGGSACYEMEAGFDDPTRFGPGAAAPRTAVGIGGDGKLILVSAASASIQQLREIMLELGCAEAVNLDGGGSRGLFCNGTFQATPGRQLTTVLEFFLTD